MKDDLPKNVKTLGWVSLLNDASSDMIYPLLPIFLTKVLGASLPFIGLIEGVAESTASLLKVFSGWLSDRLHKRKTLTVIGYTLSAISKPLFAFAQFPWHVLFIRFSDRLGKGLRQAPRDALIAESTPPEQIGTAFGYHKAMDTMGATIGPLIAMMLLALFNNNLRLVFLLSFVASFFAVLTLIFFVKEKAKPKEKRPLPHLSLKLLPRRYKLFLLGIGVFALGNFSDTFLFLRAENVGIATAFIPLLYALSNIFFAGLATYFGKLADSVGAIKVATIGYIVFSLTQLGFGFFANVGSVWLLFPLYGVFSAMTESIYKTITVQNTDPHLKGSMLGLMHTTLGICQLPASVIAGLLWEKAGVHTPFLLSATLAVIAAIIIWYSFKNEKTHVQTAR